MCVYIYIYIYIYIHVYVYMYLYPYIYSKQQKTVVHPHTKNALRGSDGVESDGVWWGAVLCGCDGVACCIR